MIELLIGFTITIVSLLLGFSLGRNSAPLTPEMSKKITRIFRKVVPPSEREIGPVERPTQMQNYLRDNPQIAREKRIMEQQFDELNTQ